MKKGNEPGNDFISDYQIPRGIVKNCSIVQSNMPRLFNWYMGVILYIKPEIPSTTEMNKELYCWV